MANTGRISIGRTRVLKSMSPRNAGYLRHMNAQVSAITKRIEKAINAVEGATVPAIRYALRPIYEESQILVPKDTLKLMKSGFIEVHRTSRGVSGVVGYAKGDNPKYAMIVHERTDLYHKKPTRAKFLQAAASKHVGKIRGRIAEYLQRATGLK